MAKAAMAPQEDSLGEKPRIPLFSDGKWIWERHYPEGMNWHAPILKKPLFHILDQAVEKFPDKVLCNFLGKNYTYARIGKLVAHVARGLQRMGVKKGSKVGLFL